MLEENRLYRVLFPVVLDVENPINVKIPYFGYSFLLVLLCVMN